jgi:hypothetical protein
MDKQESKRQVYRELLIFAVGEALVLALVCAGFALFGRWSGKVPAGAAVGAGLAVLNYALMALGVLRAADKAEQGDPAAGRKTMTASMLGRYLLMIAVLVLGAKSGVCNVVAMVIPLAASRLLIFAAELFRRKDR